MTSSAFSVPARKYRISNRESAMSQSPSAPATPGGMNCQSIAALLSGGLDSSIMLAMLVEDGYRVFPVYVSSGLVWESAERTAVERVCRWFGEEVAPPTFLTAPVEDLYGEHWSLTGRGIPDADSPDEAVYLPGRNLLLLVKAGLWCRQKDISRLAIGLLDGNPFADASPDFFAVVEAALNTYGRPGLTILRPLAGFSKSQLMERGKRYPLQDTFSCIAPIEGRHCGRCNKCAERRRAFADAGLQDPTVYHSG